MQPETSTEKHVTDVERRETCNWRSSAGKHANESKRGEHATSAVNKEKKVSSPGKHAIGVEREKTCNWRQAVAFIIALKLFLLRFRVTKTN